MPETRSPGPVGQAASLLRDGARAARRGPAALQRRLPRDPVRRRRLAVLAALLLLAVVVAVSLARGLPGGAPPDDSAGLAPADSLVYLHVSTDGDRGATERALEVARRFTAFDRVERLVLRRLSTRRQALDYGRDLDPWLGDEAAFVLVNTTGTVAGSLIVLDVTDEGEAKAFLRRTAGPAGRTTYRGVEILRYGPVSAAFVQGQMIIGQEAELRRSIETGEGDRPSLADSDAYRDAISGLPEDRVADAYASADGVRRLLEPQPGVLGAIGALVDRPGLRVAALGLSAQDEEARVTVRSLLRRPDRTRSFTPELAADVPEGAIAYLGATGIDRAAARLLGLAQAGGAATGGLDQLLRRAAADLGRRAGVDLQRDVLSLFRREVAVTVLPSLPAPLLAVIARTPDERRTARVLARLRGPLARLLTPAGGRPSVRERVVDGTRVSQIHIGPGVELDSAVFDGKLVVATSIEAIRQIKAAPESIRDKPDFEQTLGSAPDEVTSLVFLDFRQLLTLGERTGLGDDRSYLAVREDLQRIRAVGAATSAEDDETTAEITLSIP